jgi:hypothetical protein
MGSRMQEMRPLMLGEERAPYIRNELRTTRTFFLDTVQHSTATANMTFAATTSISFVCFS